MARVGGVMVTDRTTVNGHASRFTNNRAIFSLFYMTASTVHWSSVTLFNNTGSLHVLESTVTLINVVTSNMQLFHL